MTLISARLDFPGMGKKVETEQANFRLAKSLMKRIRAYCERNPFKPSLTQFATAAFSEYLDRHEAEIPDEPRHNRH